jgi:DNA polymerase IV
MMRATVEDAIDDLRKKCGNAAMIPGIVYDGPEKAE